MKLFNRNLLYILLTVIASPLILFATQDQCFTCHNDLGDNASNLFKEDVHYKAGLSCAGCHGGNSNSDDMDVAMNKSQGFSGVPKQNRVSETCAKCHSDASFMKKYNSKISTHQLESLQKSVHGSLATNGKSMIVQCTTCYNAHGIKKVADPRSPVYPTNVPQTCSKCHNNAGYMQTYNPSLTVDQLAKYRTSVHGKLNANGNSKTAQCASCHGSHDILTSKDVRAKTYKLNIPKTCSSCHSNKSYMKEFAIATDQHDKYKNSVHGKAVFEKNDLSAPVCNDCHGNHGATPPGLESISKVCGTCHALNAQLFSSSLHKKVFDENKYPECETCHGNHEIKSATEKLLGVSEDAICSKCHTESKNTKGYFVAKKMRRLIDNLQIADSNAKNSIFLAEQKGMDVEEAKFKLRDIHQSKLEARTIVHSFDEKKFKEVIAKGNTASKQVITEANAAIDQFYFRRYGLLIATLVITILIISIYFYIKRIEKNQ